MWKKFVAVLTIIMILSFATSMEIDRILITSEDDLIDWHSYGELLDISSNLP